MTNQRLSDAHIEEMRELCAYFLTQDGKQTRNQASFSDKTLMQTLKRLYELAFQTRVSLCCVSKIQRALQELHKIVELYDRLLAVNASSQAADALAAQTRTL